MRRLGNKLREGGLGWLGHVKRREPGYMWDEECSTTRSDGEEEEGRRDGTWTQSGKICGRQEWRKMMHWTGFGGEP